MALAWKDGKRVAVIDLTEKVSRRASEVRELGEMRREFTQDAIRFALEHHDTETDAAHALGLTCRGLVSMRRRFEV